MNPFNRNKPVHSLYKEVPFEEKLNEFWTKNQALIGLLLVIICISVLIIMLGYAVASGHLHLLSTEANRYEHLNQIVLYIGGIL